MKYENMSFEYLNDNKIVCVNKDYKEEFAEWNFIVSDIDWKPFGKFVKKIFASGYHTGRSKTIYKKDNKVFAYAQHNPVIYSFDNDSITSEYNLKFGKYQLPPLDYLERISANNINFFGELWASEYVECYGVFDVGKTLCVDYFVTQNCYIGLYDKVTKKTYGYTQKDFQNSLKIGKIDHIVGVTDKFIIAVLRPFDALDEETELAPELQKLAEKSLDDDNPILCLFRIK